MKKLISKILLALISTLTILNFHSDCPAQTAKDKAPSKIQRHSINADEVLIQKGFVNDFAEILDKQTKDKLEQTLSKFKSKAKIDFVIVTVKTIGEENPVDYSLRLANGWAIGATNPDKAGVLMFIAVESKRWHIQITRELEKALSNTEVRQLGELMVPLFREKRYGEGITKCVDAFIKVLKERRSKK
ncbi:MAG TPA: TPM domain-containing protein [Pyrinomonadaceae bacterium]|jgi:uncharacterized protein